MLGFATVDLSERDQALTVWLTSLAAVRVSAEVGHTNAVRLDLADEAAPRRAWSMTCDRYVVLTGRTPRDHPALAGWGLVPCDLDMLAELTVAAQETIMTAFTAYVATKRGKAAELVDPVLPPVPPPLDQAALDGETPEQLTLAVANQVKRTWAAWLAAERERVKRRAYMPGGRKDEQPSALPAEFSGQYPLQPARAWAR
jgi:hypothetical protein